ncbi:hypothetical protein GGR53DRAFT_467961 [Hypoxylon sp. FL1150]|nr:hypothetical protein GGR53DRAFT_467961 [Hypoxylon sp. FL1150]
MSRALLFAALLRSAAALLVANGSPCSTQCGNVLSSTTDDMIVCDESAYSTTTNGQVFEACIGCESTSSYSTTQGQQNVSDLQYMLYNMRYATNICLYENGTTPCITSFACQPIMNAIQYGNLSASSSEYAYCDLWTETNLDKCQACLQASNEHYLSNYVSILDGACRLKLEPPSTLPLQGSIFSTNVVNVTSPTPTATFTATGLTGPLDSGAIAGIAIGGLVVLLAIAGCGIVLNGKRRRKAYLRRRETASKNWPQGSGRGGNGGEMFETPISQRPLRGWEDSPVSAATQTTFPPYFSPYASQYNSPVSAVEGPSHHSMAWPAEKTQAQNIGVAISPDRDVVSSSPWDDRKGKEKDVAGMEGDDGYELQEGVNSPDGGYPGFPIPPPPPLPTHQAPVLSHPGYGRNGIPPQVRRTSREDDGDLPGGAL